MPSNQNPWDYDFETSKDTVKNNYDNRKLKKSYLNLISYFRTASKQIENEILYSVANDKPESAYWTKRKKVIDQLYDNMMSQWRDFIHTSTPQSYLQGQSLAEQMIRSSDVFQDYGDTASFKNKISLSPVATDPKVIDSLSLDSIAYMNRSIENGKENVGRLFRSVNEVVQNLISEDGLNTIIASGLVKGNTSESVKQELFKELLEKHGTGPLIINGRRYKPDKYAEMLARTRIREAQTEGVIRYAEESGNDLVRVSDHSTLTTICQEFEGNIYSISGKHPKYPKLIRKTPFHPNCLHVITIWIDVESILGYNPYPPGDPVSAEEKERRRKNLRKTIEGLKT
jgi:hypothetical protein